MTTDSVILDGTLHLEERVGPAFGPAGMIAAQAQSWACVDEIRRRFTVGMTEVEALAMAKAVVKDTGAEKHWHLPKIRFDEGTLLKFSDGPPRHRSLERREHRFHRPGPRLRRLRRRCGGHICRPRRLGGQAPRLRRCERDLR